jgi:hypothetical protein
MGITSFTTSNATEMYQDVYIPQRLAALEMCVIACYSVLSDKADSTTLSLNFGSSSLTQLNSNTLTQILMDAGLVANRTLLNFMGVKLENGQLKNIDYALNIESFGLTKIPVATATQISLPEIPAVNMEKIWLKALRTASQASAHFTKEGAQTLICEVGFACFATSKLVRQHFYSAKSLTPPSSLIPASMEPKFGGVWDAVEPQLMC